MKRSYAPLPPVVRLDPQWRGRWPAVARVGIVAVSALTVALFVAALPIAFEQYQGVCGEAVVEACGFQLPPEGVERLQAAGLSPSFNATFFLALQGLYASVYLAVAGLVFWRNRTNPISLFVVLFLVTAGAGSFIGATEELVAAHPAWWLSVNAVKFIGDACLVLFFFVFPDGRFTPRWTAWLAPLWLAVMLFNRFAPDSPLASGTWPLPLALGTLVLLFGSCILAQVLRYRRVSDQVQRQQMKWVVYGVSVALGGFVAIVLVTMSVPAPYMRAGAPGFYATNALTYAVMLLVPLSIGTAVLRFRLWDVDPIINRTLVYGALTATIVGVYVAVVSGLGILLQTSGNLLLSLPATALIALTVHPLREWLQRGVNRLMYGQRDEPYAVLSQLSERIERTLVPEGVLPALTETVAQALKLPYAAIVLTHGGVHRVAAEWGAPGREHVVLPLVHQGESVGEMRLEQRAPGEPFRPAEERLLKTIAQQASVAAYAVQQTTDLQRSRERLVTAREEERRRIRRNLHDGLGPSLASLTLMLEAARNTVRVDPDGADELLLELKQQTQDAISDIRRLVYDLRPPVLDEIGLLAALREQAARHRPDEPRLIVDAPSALPPLSAAVELAAYRIIQEALTNTVRHARASASHVSIDVGDGLRIAICDDGVGLPAGHRAGMGLHSMRERAEELGGTFAVRTRAGGGTCITARLPLEQET
jgi:signal transduction histidine kinase